MIEPRRGFVMLQKRDSQERHSFYSVSEEDEEQVQQQRLVLEHDEPDIPIHPALEYEIVTAVEVQPTTTTTAVGVRQKRPPVVLCNAKLLFSFVGLVVFGSAHAISLKLQTIPMYNYPNFLNLFINAMYIPICFAYIIPAASLGWFRRRGDRDSSDDSPPDTDQDDPAEENDGTASVPEADESGNGYSPPTPQRQLTEEESPLFDEPEESPLLREQIEGVEEQQQPQQQHQQPTYTDLAIMGALDSLATSMQILAAVYLPGPLLILLPQAAVPLSLLLSLKRRNPRMYRKAQYAGAAVVVLGIIILVEPLLTHRLAPSFYCEAIDFENDCSVCKYENDQEMCLAHLSSLAEDDDGLAQIRSLRSELTSFDDNPVTPTDSLCQWIPYEEARREEEILTSSWSLVLIASCIPMTLSTLYKEKAMGGESAASQQNDPIYLNGWIAVFQLFFSVPLIYLAGVVSSPQVGPSEVPQNLWDGLKCYLRGIGSISGGCHPDDLCGSVSFWLVNFHLVTTLGYSYFMLYCLKYGTTTLFFLALTVMVPLGTMAFVMPFMPQAITPCISDLVGFSAIVIGLILYRFFDRRRNSTEDEQDELENVEEDEPIFGAFFALQRDLSAALLREPLLSGDV